MMKKLLRILNLRDESGATVVIVAISMVVLLGFAALAIDGGRIYLEKSKLQKALDAAVLAGAQGLNQGETEAIANAKDVASDNGFPLTERDLTIIGNSIRATKQTNVSLTFARVLGITDSRVSSTAKAVVGHLKTAKGITPIAVEESQIPNGKELTCSSPGKTHGNCGFLALDGTGASNLADALRNGNIYSVGNQVKTEPGEMWGPVSSAINDLISSDSNKPHCQSATTADNRCKRVINIVVIDTWDGVNGRDKVNVTGFATYWVQGFNNKTLMGEFIERFQPGEISDGGIGTLYSVKLVE
ncbi:pilus assembly protein [Bacillus sp. ISL-75]|uniref:pilus assembly protein TadG-related protein n=1 Tax=Bacillus sp. ISL-75 TaxID=2819137 RepID=UPI001BEBF6EC|nr:TadE/TadG family type IV pilus assembly protein [Bacillus sp. ISL-75]MBT2727432.1 pilus assembly protein [Bacillus sp. ISL-75]